MTFEFANKNPATVAITMQSVLLALLPGSLVFIYQTGWGSVINLILAIASALAFETLSQSLRKRPAKDALADYSAIVTAVLIALCLPPLLPWWMPVLASGFAILLAKQVFGGLGYNLFNPAMVGYAVLLISFPGDLGLWLIQPDGFSLSLFECIKVVFAGGLVTQPQWDAITAATSLDLQRDLLLQGASRENIATQTQGLFGAVHSEWVNLAYLAGGLYLWHKHVINWHIPLSFLATLAVCNLLHQWFISDTHFLSVQLFGGATMLCAFFISTDPVSAAASNRGRIIYAALTGLLVYLIRNYGAYPDSIAFAVLLANCTVPLIDRLNPWLYPQADE